MKLTRCTGLFFLLLAVFSANTSAQSLPGTISTVAGNGGAGFSGDGGLATSAQLMTPLGLAVDAAGNLYIADAGNHRVRKVSPAGIVTTAAGNGSEGFSGDGSSAALAKLFLPVGVMVDVSGNILIADSNNERIRKVSSAGVISTIAGTGSLGFGGDGGLATSAQLAVPYSIAMDPAGNIYIADSVNMRIRKIAPDGIISIAAGDGTEGFTGDEDLAVTAQLASPSSVAVDAAGNLYIADAGNNRIRKVSPDGLIVTVAGDGTAGYAGDGDLATVAQLSTPSGVAVDNSGNLYIADTGNNRIRLVRPDGIIVTIAGDGNQGFSGDGMDPAMAQFDSPSAVALDAQGNVFIADTNNGRIRKITFGSTTPTFTITDRGGTSSLSAGSAASIGVGYGAIRPDPGNTTPSGLAIFGFRENNILVSEAGVPATAAIVSGRIYAEVGGAVNTGLAIANPNETDATVNFFFTNASGNFGGGTTTIPARGQIARFLDQAPFNSGGSVNGTFTFTSSLPLAVIALRGFTNERGEFLITTLPLADLSAPASPGPLVFPHFADGGGWTTQVVLVNTGDSVLSGTVQFRNPAGQAATVSVGSQAGTSFNYSIPARSSQKLPTAGAGSAILTGSVQVVPAAGTSAPSGLAIFSFRNNGVTVAEAGVPAVPSGTAFRLYAEASGNFSGGAAGSIQTGLAIANTSANAATVTLELAKLDGTSTGLTGTLQIPANGQTAIFLNQVQGLASLTTPFKGVLRVSSSSSLSMVGLRGRYNERADFLITTTPPVNEAGASTAATQYFPHIVDGGGYTTQFILFSGLPGQLTAGTMQLFGQSGSVLVLTLRTDQ